ncbi:aspartyl/asparaginyl beta-hydroxylase domain-containing protein [Streptomyces sp. NPDC051956]|uniref:aspartyl/asparaginyl beta-hydroxylase domain-containing protein n=1 Tax=Streptomyces sp. NPDC051956 TaxID=3365677 RepID=UPI0037D7B3A5
MTAVTVEAAHQDTAHDLEIVVPGLVFDPVEIRRAHQQFLDRVPPAPSGRPEDRFRRLGLTHRPGAEDPWRDAGTGQFDQVSGERRFEEAEFSVFNEELSDTYFHHILSSLPFRVGRTRLVTLHPSEIYHMHCDASRVAHLAIETNEDSRFLYRAGTTHHVPVDGRIRVFNTKLPHSAYNAGASDRIHLTMTLVD